MHAITTITCELRPCPRAAVRSAGEAKAACKAEDGNEGPNKRMPVFARAV
jgi:hypothetical protein